MNAETEMPSTVADTRRIPLGRLAREADSAAAAKSLRNVLGDEAGQRLAVAAFTSAL
jgi:FXSXX-COOH protein